MHIPERRRIPIAEIDLSILDRISERDIEMWIAARFHQMRESAPLTVMNVEVWHRNYRNNEHVDTSWNLHAIDAIALTHITTQSALGEVLNELGGNPAEKAEEKRREARMLLNDAERYEAAAKKIKEVTAA